MLQDHAFPLRSVLLLLTLCVSVGCSQHELRDEVTWVATSDEWKQQAQDVYAKASAHVASVASSRQPGSWAVVMDIDETVLNNIGYTIKRERMGKKYTDESWETWINATDSPLVPGAKGFIKAVNDLGGHIVFVTNRSDRLYLATERNLAALDIKRVDDFSILLTRPLPLKEHKNKQARFSLVKPMLAAMGHANVETIAYIGDNNGDKPKKAGNFRFFCINQGALYGDYCHR